MLQRISGWLDLIGSLSISQTARANASIRWFGPSADFSILIYKNSFLESKRDAFTVAKNRRLRINKSWTGRSPFPFYVTVEPGGKIIARDNFTFYEGGHVGVGPSATLSLGRGYANRNVNISCRKEIYLGENCLIGPNVVIRDCDDHVVLQCGADNLHHSATALPKAEPVRVEDDVWIGSNAIILKGVTIGRGSVIAAGAVVTRSVPPRSLAAGVPARVVKKNITWI